MDIFADVQARVATALKALQSEGALPADLVIDAVDAEPPRDSSHGDVSSNAAMVLAKPAKMKPRDIAELLKAKLSDAPDVMSVDIAGPGFLNITFKLDVWADVVRAVLDQGPDFGRGAATASPKINIEYVSANPTGPMHVGHCRGAVFGDALANLIVFAGGNVTREYYINNAGGQVDVLARSAFLRYREALGEEIGAIPEGLYPGDYLKPAGKLLAKTFGRALLGKPEETWLPQVRAIAIDAMMDMIRDDLAALNIRHDVFFSEASLSAAGGNKIDAAIAALRERGLIYEGRLEKPKGHDDADWEDREQTLFRSTAFGDDADRALLKGDGGYTYFAGDIAYHYDKLQRGYTSLINVFGADHVGYIPRMKAAIAALSDQKAHFDIKVVQLVRLFRGGEPVKMSKRAGTFVTLREVVDEVGRDPVRFMMLYRKNDATLDFDFVKVTEQSKDNPVFYVQYAHARAASVFRNALDAFPGLDAGHAVLGQAELQRLADASEIDVIRRLANWPRLVKGAAAAHEPHRLAFYLYDLASAFHGLWSKGNDSPHLRFIQLNDGVATSARLALVAAVQQVLSSGLGVLGVEAPETMR